MFKNPDFFNKSINCYPSSRNILLSMQTVFLDMRVKQFQLMSKVIITLVYLPITHRYMYKQWI